MGMDEEWRKSYEERAKEEVPEHLKGFWSKKGYEQLLEVTLHLIAQLPKGRIKTVLDVGCGVGRYCREISALGFNTTGVDYSKNLVAEARLRYPDLNFLVSNGYNLPFAEKSFDLVLSVGVLQCLEDYKKYLTELTRVSDKYVIISTLLAEKKRDLDEHLKEMLKSDSFPTREYHPEQLTQIFEDAGFQTRVITHHEDSLIHDGFFILAERINFQ